MGKKEALCGNFLISKRAVAATESGCLGVGNEETALPPALKGDHKAQKTEGMRRSEAGRFRQNSRGRGKNLSSFCPLL